MYQAAGEEPGSQGQMCFAPCLQKVRNISQLLSSWPAVVVWGGFGSFAFTVWWNILPLSESYRLKCKSFCLLNVQEVRRWHKYLELDSGADWSFSSEPAVWDSEFDDISSLQGEVANIYRLCMKAWGYIHNWKSTQLPLHSHLLGQHVCASVNLLQNARGSEPALQKWGKGEKLQGRITEGSEVSTWNVAALILRGGQALGSLTRLDIIREIEDNQHLPCQAWQP